MSIGEVGKRSSCGEEKSKHCSCNTLHISLYIRDMFVIEMTWERFDVAFVKILDILFAFFVIFASLK